MRLLEEAKKAEEAELFRLELLRIAQEEIAVKKAEEKRLFVEKTMQRFAKESEDDLVPQTFRQEKVNNFKLEAEDADEWVKYLACNPLPSIDLAPFQERSLNTYMSMIRELDDEEAAEEFLHKPLEHLPHVLRECERTEEVLALMAGQLGKARQAASSSDLIPWCREYVSQCRRLTQFKLDKITAALLQQADDYEDEHHILNKDFLTANFSFGLWAHSPPKNNFSKVNKISFKDIAFDIELPGPLRSIRTCIRVLHSSYDTVSSRKEDKDRADREPNMWTSVGGTVTIQQLAMPPAPRKVKGWTLREVSGLSRKIQPIPYPSRLDASSGNAAQSGPLKIKYRVPEGLLLRGPEVGYWDDRRGQWQTEGADGMTLCEKYDPDSRLLVLSLPTLAPFAIIQPRALDFPYLHWGIAPLGPGACILKALGSRFEVAFHFDNSGKCKLLQPALPQLQNVLGLLFYPGELLTKLALQGLNLMPTDEDAALCRKQLRPWERQLHSHVAQVCGVFAMKACRFNSSRGPSKCMFQARLAKDSFAVKELPSPDPSVIYPHHDPEKDVLGEASEQDAKRPPTSRAVTPALSTTSTREASEGAGQPAQEDEPQPLVPDWVQVLAEPDRFSLTLADHERGCEDLLNQEMCHSSLRRCLYSHYDRPYVHAVTNVAVQEALGFMDRDLIGLQEGVLNFLNLLRPFVFH